MKQTTLLLLLLWSNYFYAQPTFTANDEVPVYTDVPFRIGVNPGSHGDWDDDQLADISAGNADLGIPGAGIKAFRASLPEKFVLQWGYDVRVDEFEHYASLGMDKHTVFLQDPSDAHVDMTAYCPDEPSLLFADMYLPIWDNGENGTPVNDDNHAALYVYNTVNTYKDYVQFWEIYNEPDFDYSNSGWREAGDPGNWFENVPEPCDYKLRTPVYHYIRMLRIAYEVTKTVDPDAYVGVGGLGYTSFLDIILRHTDNPDGGQVTADYPLTGGAYFDCMSYHCYPHIDGGLRYWSNDAGGFVYTRHSDAAVEEVVHHKEEFEDLLFQYGYDGTTYPQKVFINTESNIPRKQFGDQFGSNHAQRNFGIKVQVEAQKNDIKQLHFYNLADKETFEDASSWSRITGLYQKLSHLQPYDGIMINDEGLASRTTTSLLFEKTYDAAATAALNLPETIRGGVFMDENNVPTYVLWAITQTDMTEAASAVYSFPSSLNYETLDQYAWDFGATGTITSISPDNVQLTGDPIFLKATIAQGMPPVAGFTSNYDNNCAPGTIQFTDQSSNQPTSYTWSFPNGNPTTSNIANPSISYNASGTYTATLTVLNDFGESTESFTFTIYDGEELSLMETINEGDNYTVGTSVYTETGTYTDVLVNQFGCDSIVHLDLTVVPIAGNAPIADFSTTFLNECAPVTVQFTDQSTNEPTSFHWAFFGGGISTSTIQNPIITYDVPGTYEAVLTVQNAFGESTDNFIFSVHGSEETTLAQTITEGESYSIGTSVYTEAGMYIDTLQNEHGCDSIVHLDLTVVPAGMPPVAAFTSNYDNNCAPTTIQFSNQSSNNPDSYLWTFPGGIPSTSTLTNPNVSYNAGGTYEATLSAQNDFGESTESFTFIVYQGSEMNTVVNIYEGESYTVGNSVYTETGMYSDTLENQFGCDSIIHLDLTVVIETGLPAAAFSSEFEGICVPVDAQFFNQSSDNTTSFEWSFTNSGMTTTSTLENPAFTFINPGLYEVTLVAINDEGSDAQDFTFILYSTDETNVAATINEGEDYALGTSIYTETGMYIDTLLNQYGCDSIVHLDLTVIPAELAPVAAFSISLDANCAPVSVQFTDESSNNPSNYLWSFPNGNPATSTLANPSVSYAQGGTYTAILSAQNSAGEDSESFMFTIGEDVEVDITATINEGESYTVGNSTYTQTGIYINTLQSQFGCDSIVNLDLTVLTSVFSPTIMPLQINVIPNPTTTRTSLFFTLPEAMQLSVVLYDIRGQLLQNVVTRQAFSAGNKEISIDLQEVPAGVYFVRIETEKTVSEVVRIIRL